MYDIKVEEYREDRWWPRVVAAALGVLLIGVLAWFILRSSGSDGDTSPPPASDDTVAGSVVETDDADDSEESVPETDAVDDDDPAATTGDDGDTAATEPEPGSDETDDESASTDVERSVAASTDTPAETEAPTESPPAAEPEPEAPATEATAAPDPTTAPPAAPETPSYPTLPDGSPAPVVAVFGVDQITLTGEVPSEGAKERLQALAVANAKPGQDANIANFVAVNPAVPAGVGVRVVELTSVRFPEGSAEVLPAHAQELDRVASIMNALPNVTALVIGHADQRGDENRNFVLSAARAESVVDYLAFTGIAPDRLSSRAVGEADLLTLNDDDAALALNRRTEFVFYGLLLE